MYCQCCWSCYRRATITAGEYDCTASVAGAAIGGLPELKDCTARVAGAVKGGLPQLLEYKIVLPGLLELL